MLGLLTFAQSQTPSSPPASPPPPTFVSLGQATCPDQSTEGVGLSLPCEFDAPAANPCIDLAKADADNTAWSGLCYAQCRAVSGCQFFTITEQLNKANNCLLFSSCEDEPNGNSDLYSLAMPPPPFLEALSP